MKKNIVSSTNYLKGISKNLAFDYLILNPSTKREGQKEFLEIT
jgi:phosphoribosylaminoimidazole-succinocarboxamide synthase